MTRKETIDKYISAFLKGRSQEAIEKFKAKAEHLQYASIMQWRRRVSKLENTPKSTKEILETLSKADALIVNAPEISDEDMEAISAGIQSLHSTLQSYFERQRQRRINELEAQQRSISEKLAQLRNL